MPYLEIGDVYEDLVNIVIYTEGYTYFRLFCRPSYTSTAEEKKFTYEPYDFSTYFDGLIPGTEYVLNLMYGNSASTCTNYAYSSGNLPTFTTPESSGGGGGETQGSGLVYIDGNWYKPYIYVGTWVEAIPYVYDGNWAQMTN